MPPDTPDFMDPGDRAVRTSRLGRLFGLTSLFSDFSYEMAHAILPFWIRHLGGGAVVLALVEVLSEVARITGSVAVRRGARTGPGLAGKVRAGYTLAMIATPVMAAATASWHIIILKSVSWFGKGLRGPARDTLLSERIEPDLLTGTFAFIQALDQTGGILGPALAVILWGTLSARTLLWSTLLPGVVSIWFAHRAASLAAATPLLPESPAPAPPKPHLPHPDETRFRLFLIGSVLVRMGLFPATLLMFRFEELTDLTRFTGAGFVFANIVHVAAAVGLSRRGPELSPWAVLFAGSACLVPSLVLMGLAGGSHPLYLAAMSLWGMSDVFLSVGQRSLVARLAPGEDRLRAFSLFEIWGAIGVVVFQPAMSFLWERGYPVLGFGGAAAAVVAGTLVGVTARKRDRTLS
jgi:hypothetical protein